MNSHRNQLSIYQALARMRYARGTHMVRTWYARGAGTGLGTGTGRKSLRKAFQKHGKSKRKAYRNHEKRKEKQRTNIGKHRKSARKSLEKHRKNRIRLEGWILLWGGCGLCAPASPIIINKLLFEFRPHRRICWEIDPRAFVAADSGEETVYVVAPTELWSGLPAPCSGAASIRAILKVWLKTDAYSS